MSATRTFRAVGWVALAAACGRAGGQSTDVPGDPDRGRALLREYGCATCHVVPGIREVRGTAGPPLDYFARREFIAGTLLNTPENLARWIREPQSIEPGTVMPDLGVSPSEAVDMAAYLLALR